MKRIKKIIFHAGLFFSGMMSLSAQEAIPASGGEASGAGGTVSYTVGQVLYNTYSVTGNSEAQGVQQPYEISTVVGLEKLKEINLNCQVYPNPTLNYLTLEIEHYKSEDLSYCLYDVLGRLLEKGKITCSITSIYMEDYLPASYLLQVLSESKNLQTFKIIKN
jgi:hypothetical protein